MSETNQNTSGVTDTVQSDTVTASSNISENEEIIEVSPQDGITESETNRPVFAVDDETSEESEEEVEQKVDLSQYTVVDADNLDEDDVMSDQQYALFSFMSPEGIMNCNMRLIKFRGAFPTMEKAREKAEELKKTDKYFKIHCAEQGKWVEFDPPEEHVEEIVAGNKKQQEIIDAQRKAKMDKMNELATRHKQKMDKTDRSSDARREESKKAGAAEEHASKARSNSQAKKQAKQERQQGANGTAGVAGADPHSNNSASARARRERLRKRLEAKRAKEAEATNKKRLQQTDNHFQSGQVTEEGTENQTSQNLQERTEIVNKASDDLEQKKTELASTNANIARIRELMSKR